MGSVNIVALLSPARLGQAGDLSCVRHLAEAHTTESKLAVHRTGTAATAAAGIRTHFVLRRSVRFVD